MQTLGVVFAPLNRFSADKKTRFSFFLSSLTYFSFIKIGGGHLARFPCEFVAIATVVDVVKIVFNYYRSLYALWTLSYHYCNDVIAPKGPERGSQFVIFLPCQWEPSDIVHGENVAEKLASDKGSSGRVWASFFITFLV